MRGGSVKGHAWRHPIRLWSESCATRLHSYEDGLTLQPQAGYPRCHLFIVSVMPA